MPSSITGTKVLTAAQIAAAAKAAGFTGQGLVIAVAVALAESGGDAYAQGDLQMAPYGSYGLWQINSHAWPTLIPLDADTSRWYEPVVNAGFAYIISHQGTYWTPWSVYNSGSYLTHMATAQAAVASLTQGGIMTKADKIHEGAHLMVGFPYMLGYESNPAGVADSKYDVGDPAGSNPKWGDCSGDVWALWVYAGVTRNGVPIGKADRHTAATYYGMATTKLAAPQLPGDLVFLAYSDGRIHHIGIYLGGDEVFEMGDGTGHAAIHTVAYWRARTGFRCARIPGLDIGLRTPVPVSTTTTVTYSDWPELIKNPFEGPHVKVLKVWLNAVMGSHLDVTNDHYLDATEAVVKAFQKKNWPNDSHQWDGKVGDLTQRALYNAFIKI